LYWNSIPKYGHGDKLGFEGSGVLGRIGGFCYRRRRLVVGCWAIALVGLVLAARGAGGETASVFSVPGTESQRAFDLLEARFPELSGDTADIVFHSARGVDDPAVRKHMKALFTQVESVDHVLSIASPYRPAPRPVSADGTTAFATIQFDARAGELRKAGTVEDLKQLRDEANSRLVQVELGGRVIQFAEIEGPGGRGEQIGLLVAILVLLVSFGSVVAMGLPILTAVFSLGVALSLLALTANVLDLSDFAPRLATLIGLGVGIDYALLIVTRYRQGLHAGLEPDRAVRSAMSTAGRAVMFAGFTVVLSLGGMLVMGVPIVQTMAVGAGMAVLTVMAAALTLVPALLGFTGRAIDRLRIPGLHRDETAHRVGWWFRWSRVVQRRPWPFVMFGLAILIVLALPMLSLRLGSSDAGADPTTKTSRRAYDLISGSFGPGFNGPLILATRLPAGSDAAVLNPIVSKIQASDGVLAVAAPRINTAGDAAVITVFPKTSPQDADTLALINHLRDDVVPDATRGTGVTIYIGGITAVFDDLGVALADRLPLFIGVVLGLSFLLLMMVFRSVVIPLKAVVMNLLSIGAAYGVIVAVFQWGWAKDVVGIDQSGPIQSFIPMLLFAVLFGLSMDYEVFLLSRIREEYVRTGDNGLAVADGLAATARVITAAAAIMVAVFGAAVLGEDRTTKLFGLGLATAIFLDATVVRTLLVPATMELLGDANWWIPRWLDRLLPRISVEAEDATDRAVLADEITEITEAADAPVGPRA